MKKTPVVLSGAVFIFGLLFILHAQQAAVSSQSATLAVQTDSVVQLVADSYGLSLVSPAVPAGTFWVVAAGGALCPQPCPPPHAAHLPVYDLTGGGTTFLVDATGGQVVTAPDQSVADALAGLADSVVKLITWIQAAPATRPLARAMGMTAELAAPAGFSPRVAAFDTNSLFLQITNVANGTVFVNLMNATDYVYEIYSKSDLTAANWDIAGEVFPANTNCMPCTVPALAGTNLYIWARDWTGVTSHGSTTPEWWFYYYFGTVALSDTSLDSQGNTLLYDYQNGLDPNVISFGLAVTNNYVSTMNAPVQVNLTAGTPSYYAVSVDATNYATAASWQPYTSTNLNVYLGLTEGWHDVWVGLKGLPSGATQTWQWKRLKLDLTPPLLVVTSPTNGTVSVPMMQLQGYSPEALGGISYDLTNAAGLVTNQQVLITGQAYSTNTWEFTTNWFQAFDILLTNGLNTITVHATDLAGNVTTTSFTFNLDYSGRTNPPAVQLYWPQDGMQVSGTNFTVSGQLDDPADTVSVQMVAAGGMTNVVAGVVGRDGRFWVQNLQLNSGTNTVTLTASDILGNTATTNLTVIQSAVGLTINPVAAGQVTVTGTINPGGYTVWVNGVKATDNGDGTWTAQITPITIDGGTVSATAIPNTDNDGNGSGGGGGDGSSGGSGGSSGSGGSGGGSGSGSSGGGSGGGGSGGASGNPDSAGGVNGQVTVAAPPGIYIASYHMADNWDSTWEVPLFDWNEFSRMDWDDGGGGKAVDGADGQTVDEYDWPASYWPQPLADGTWLAWVLTSPTNGVWETNAAGGVNLKQEHCAASEVWLTGDEQRTADTEMKLATGGPLGSTQKNLWVISASATGYTNLSDPQGYPIPFDQISIGSLGKLDTNGNLYVMLPDNDPDNVTPKVLGFAFFHFNVGATKHPLAITANNDIVLSNDVVAAGADFCVGQGITFDVTGLPSPVYNLTAIWTLPGNFVNTNSDPDCPLFYEENAAYLNPPQGTSAIPPCWYVKDGQSLVAKVHIYYRCTPNGILFDQTLTGLFNVHRPTTTQATPYQPDGTPTAEIVNGTLSLGVSGVANDMSFSHNITTDGFCAGQAGYFQLVRGSYTDRGTGNTLDVAPDDGAGTPDTELDNNAPNRGPFSISANTNNTVVFQDAPADGLHQGNAQEDLEFSNYLMFKPNGGIWVPLRLITWELHDEAANNAIVSGKAPITSDADCTTFPDWKNTFKNHGM